MSHNPLYAFLLKAALWLPVCLGLWYWQAEWFNALPLMLSGWIMQGAFPDWVSGVEWSQRVFVVFTRLAVEGGPRAEDGRVALLVAEVNPLSYSFGLSIFAALMLASGEAGFLRKMLFGLIILIPFQTWGICFDLLKQVAITAGPVVSAQTGFSAWQRNAIALGYQFGALILPSLTPIALWLAFNRRFIPMLMLEGVLRRE